MDTCVSGIALLSHSLSFLPNQELYLKPFINFYADTPFDDSEMKIFANTNILTLHITTINGYNLNLCVAKSGVHDNNDASHICDIFINSVDFAIQSLGTSQTLRYWMGKCCSTYSKVVKDKCPSIEEANKIFVTDVQKFGEYLSKHLFETINPGSQNVYQPVFVLCKSGQVIPWNIALEQLAVFKNFNDVSELVVFLSMDYKTNEKCSLWNRDKINSYEKITHSYYPGLTSNVGNFVIRTNFEKRQAAVPYAIVKKFTSSICSNINQICPAPFQQCLLTESLVHGDMSNSVSCEKSIEATKRAIKNLCDEKTVFARFEVGFHVSKPDREHLLSVLLKQFQTLLLSSNPSQFLVMFEFADFEKQIRETITPVLNTLDLQLTKWKKMRATNPYHYATIGEILSVDMCENLAQYFIHGTNVSKSLGVFNARTAIYLGLCQDTFKNHMKTFRGLTFCKWIKVSGNTVQYQRIPPFSEEYIPKIVQAYGKERAMELWDYMTDTPMYIHCIWGHIKYFFTHADDTFDKVENSLKNASTITPIGVHEYIHLLVSDSCNERTGCLVQVVRSILSVSKQSDIDFIKTTLVNRLVALLSKRHTCVALLPMAKGSCVRVVMLTNEHYNIWGKNTQNRVVRMYVKLARLIKNRELLRIEVDKVLKCQTFNWTVNQIIEKMVIDSFYSRLESKFANSGE